VAKVFSASTISVGVVNVGFVPLFDAAPLIVALEMGYFADEHLRVVLHRQIGWGNVRDKLTFGQLDASHALLGMPPLSVLGKDLFVEPLVAIVALGTGGNAITISRRLAETGVNSAATLAKISRQRHGGPLVLAHVFSCSTHHYLLRQWLAGAGIDPEKDVRLCVLPPPQMVRQLAKGLLDGFCVGEPWNLLAERDGVGSILASTVQIVRDHPEKVLAVTQRWLARHGDVAQRLVRAILRAAVFCEDKRNGPDLCKILSGIRYLDTPAEILVKSLALTIPGSDRMFRSWASQTLAPNPAHAHWLLAEMIRWGHLPPNTDIVSASKSSVDAGPYLAASDSLNSARPLNDQILEGVN
jgi:nitrate/nitrite transport system substrate-binding protein